jgi:hypothetical protein
VHHTSRVVIDRRFLCVTGEAALETAPSQKRRAKRLVASRQRGD